MSVIVRLKHSQKCMKCDDAKAAEAHIRHLIQCCDDGIKRQSSPSSIEYWQEVKMYQLKELERELQE